MFYRPNFPERIPALKVAESIVDQIESCDVLLSVSLKSWAILPYAGHIDSGRLFAQSI
jgi:hypothetical protein